MEQLTQEAIYAQMNTRNREAAIQVYDMAAEPRNFCIAAYSLGQWHLLEAFRRLHAWFDDIFGAEKDEYITTYVPSGAASAGHGILHQTLLQVISFQGFSSVSPEEQLEVVNCIKETLATEGFGTTITYRGLVFTSTGMALCGYSPDYARIMRLRTRIEGRLRERGLPCHIPYLNDILHSTVFRWKKVPPEAARKRLLEEACRWSEAVFGHIQIAKYTVGLGTLLMRETDRRDTVTVFSPLQLHHRGNSRCQPCVENDPAAIEQLVGAGRHVEIDIWRTADGLFLGHDTPMYPISIDWICNRKDYLLIHCKDGTTFSWLVAINGEHGYDLNLFYHTDEDYVLSSRGWIIAYPGKQLYPDCLNMMPEMAGVKATDYFAICSDLL